MLDVDQHARWNTFFESRFELTDNLKLSWPDKKYIEVEHLDLIHLDEEFGIQILENPNLSIKSAEKVLSQILREDGLNYNPTVRLTGIPQDYTRSIRSIRNEDMGKLISIEGLVSITSNITPRINIAHFICCCGMSQDIEQTYLDEINSPSECGIFGGGCGRKKRDTTFELVPILSTRIDAQFITLQEAPNDVESCADSKRLTVISEGDLVNPDLGGKKVRISGVPFMQTTWKRNNKTPVTEIILKAIGIEIIEDGQKEINLEAHVIERIVNLAKTPNILDNLAKSFAPSIYGMKPQKESILLQLVGGNPKELEDGSSRRGSIHILLMGDPGVAKSQLLNAAVRISPRGRMAQGGSTSGVGLIATTEQDNITNRWFLKAGVMVSADGGLCAIDEFDKMKPDDRSLMHDAMATQVVHINKGGISAHLNTRCSVLAAANPVHGHFARGEDIQKQVNIPSPLLSRFDLTWLITDEVDPFLDRKIAGHIMGAKSEKAMFDAEFIRAYISYASTIHPSIPEDVAKVIIDAYVNDRKKLSDGYVPITHRSLEALQRLTEASAKIHLREEAIKEDAERAIRLVRQYITEVM